MRWWLIFIAVAGLYFWRYGSHWRVRLYMAALAPISTISAAHTLTAAVHYDVYLLAGQSNMDGRGLVGELTQDQRRPVEHVIIFYRNPPFSSEGWKPLIPGYSVAPGYHGSLPSGTFGPEVGFARALLKYQPKGSFALIKGSKGNTSLVKDWDPGIRNHSDSQGFCYRNFLSTIALATAALTKDGSTLTIRGLLWHQGENDEGSATADYQRRLSIFIARLREDLQQPELPVAVGEIFDNGKRDSVRAAQRAVAASMRGVVFVPTSDLRTYDGGTHFDAANQLILGERFADSLVRLARLP